MAASNEHKDRWSGSSSETWAAVAGTSAPLRHKAFDVAIGDEKKDSLSESSPEPWPPFFTPPSTVAADHSLSEHGDASTVTSSKGPRSKRGYIDIPWPGYTFRIVEKGTGKAITMADGSKNAALERLDSYNEPRTLWHCVEKNGYFGFMNPRSGRYLGHDGKDGMTTTSKLKEWEMWTPRQHPDGGYQLLSPLSSDAVMLLSVAENESSLTRRDHSTTVWEFIRV